MYMYRYIYIYIYIYIYKKKPQRHQECIQEDICEVVLSKEKHNVGSQGGPSQTELQTSPCGLQSSALCEYLKATRVDLVARTPKLLIVRAATGQKSFHHNQQKDVFGPCEGNPQIQNYHPNISKSRNVWPQQWLHHRCGSEGLLSPCWVPTSSEIKTRLS